MIVCTNFHLSIYPIVVETFSARNQSGGPTNRLGLLCQERSANVLRELSRFYGTQCKLLCLVLSRTFNILHTVFSYYVTIRNRQTQRLSFTPSRIQFAVSPFKNVFSCEMDKNLNYKRESEPLDHFGRQKWTRPAPWKIILLWHSSLFFLLLLVIKW